MVATEEQITLAPAAGAGIGKMLADELLKDPEFVPLMRSVALGCLKAMTHRFIMEEKRTIDVPDFKIQAQMFFGLMAHMEGEPVKRIIHQHLGAGGKLDVGAALTDSPELAQAVERELQKARWKHSGHQAHKKPKKVTEADGEEMPVG